MKEFRLLKANEIEVRVASISKNKKGYSVLLYKNARVDMQILDEVYGPMNWMRKHEVVNNNLFCTISLWDDEKKQWIHKQDVGIPSFSAKEKGEASDSFKRAAVNVGIGRELYTAPFLYIYANDGEVEEDNKTLKVHTKLSVKDIAYNEDREIVSVVIVDSKGNVRYPSSGYKQTTEQPKVTPQQAKPEQNYTGEVGGAPKCEDCGAEIKEDRVINYSMSNYGKVYCREHQKNHQKIS